MTIEIRLTCDACNDESCKVMNVDDTPSQWGRLISDSYEYVLVIGPKCLKDIKKKWKGGWN